MKLNIYTASPYKYGGMWKDLRDDIYSQYFHATWVDIWPEDENDCTLDFDKIWQNNLMDIEEADALILYSKPGDHLEGALVEVGFAQALGVPIFIVDNGQEYRSWVNISGVERIVPSIDAAVLAIETYYNYDQ